VTCPNCATELEINHLDPPRLDYYWQDEWDDDEDETDDQDEWYAVEYDEPDLPDISDDGWERSDFDDD
jgi:hypothetical protein